MQLSNAPGKLTLPFANGGGKNTIPVASQIGITAGAASYTDGFPPLTRTPIAAGGTPPSGLDMNGILYALSAALRWANLGGGYIYDGTFASDANINGYPKGARVLRSDGAGYWLNTVDGNTVNPESTTAGQAASAGWVPDLTNGVAAVTMTSSNVTLTPVQYGMPLIVLSGVLTANLNLIFPNLAGEWTVVNNCTGNFSVTAKTAAGAGITIASGGRRRILWGDGANLYNATDSADTPAQFDNSTLLATTAFIKAAGEAFGGIKSVSGAATLDATYAGQLTVFTGTAYTATLPAASTYPAGTTLTFYSATSGNVAVTRAGSDVISVNNASSVTALNLGSGDTLTLVSNGSSVWEAVAGSAQLRYSSLFASSLGNSGWRRTPDPNSPTGYIIEQWGEFVLATGNGDTVNFNVAFPNAVMGVWGNDYGAGCNSTACTRNGTLTSFTGWGKSNPGGGFAGTAFRWRAIGY